MIHVEREDAVALVHVGDVGDARVSDPARAVLADADLERAESLAEGDLLVVREPLLGEDQDGVLVDVEGPAVVAGEVVDVGGIGDDQQDLDDHLSRWFGKPTNLHAVWDSQLVDEEQLSFTELAAKLEREIAEA